MIHPFHAVRAPRFLPFLQPAAALALALLCGGSPCRADITLPSLISDNMVLQQRDKVNVWGKAEPGETVTVQLGTDSSQVTAAKDGSWAVKLGGLKAGGPYDMVISGKNSITVHNVAIGDVWLCAGESNMEYKVIAARNGQAELADATLPMVRVFTVKHNASEKPAADCQGVWTICDPDTARDFSAIGFFFAKELNRGMRIPIGLIQSAWGPSPAEAWTPRQALEKDLGSVLERYDKAASAYPAALSAYQARLADWKSASDAAKAAGSPIPTHAPFPPLPPGGPREPSALFNGMIQPLVHFPIRGVLWYQGETDTAGPQIYRTLFPAMIAAWRKAWNADFPFLYVQLPGFLARHPLPVESRWAELREAQALALNTPKTGMAVTIDLGEEHNMHPANKQEVAHRLALIAESQVYDKSGVTASGPVFSGMRIEDGKAVLTFAHVDGGLVVENGPLIKGFAIAGADRKFLWADVEIRENKVIVRSKEVPQPVAVRYAWADTPDCNLFNLARLPVAPFRTDNWTPGELPTASPSPSPAKTHSKHHADL